jgi:hypothetical protein
MCGDAEEGVELGVGTPCPPGNDLLKPERPWLDQLEHDPPTLRELEERERVERERDRRIDAMPVLKLAWAFSRGAREWFFRFSESPGAPPDDIFKEALAVAAHDAFLVTVKIHRALRGRDQYREDNDGDPIQNDWNGSAKVALISIERSTAAWQTIASATGTAAPMELSQRLRDLQAEIETIFPAARSFIRPGFDEPGRSSFARP